MNSRNCSNLEVRKSPLANFYCFLEKTQVVCVCAQSDHTRLRLLAETFGTTLRTADPALTYSGDFYIPAPILGNESSVKCNIFLFYFPLTLNLSFNIFPLFCVLILHCIIDAVFIFFYKTFCDILSRAHERKNIFK